MDERDRPVLLARTQKGRAVETLTRAFQDDVMYAYVFPEEEERVQALRRLWQSLLTYSLTYGQVYTTPGLAGVACWFAPGKTEPSLWRMLRTGFALPRAVFAMKREGRRRFGDALNYNDAVHARLMKEPHWYLAALGVDPARQRQGVGSRLLQPVLARADADGFPCYLEATITENVRFYERHGFQVTAEGDVPGHPMRMWAMIRRPATVHSQIGSQQA
ncbi:MAG: GNAT family N-acetyltransferase [Chloroflexota bacterium]